MTNHLDIRRVYRSEAAEARGVVIVIDVIRAFTVAAYAIAGGARRLWLVRTIDEAFALRRQEPEALLAGEIGGRLIPGFDLNNSPSLMAATDVRGRTIIQRTGAGTQGAAGAINATHLLICSLANARATATYARTLAETTDGVVTLLPTEGYSQEKPFSREDSVCADYLEALLLEQENAQAQLADNLAILEASGRFDFMKQGEADFPFEDIALIKGIDRFDFVMAGQRKQADGFDYVEVRRQELQDYSGILRGNDMENDILKEQIAYYRARSGEYEESFGEFLRVNSHRDEDAKGEPSALERAAHLLQRMGTFERVLELACGTGLWTRILLQMGRDVTAIDAAPEMLALARQKVGDASVHFEQADLFTWEPAREYDLVFFAFWLSHVPPEALDVFLDKVRRAVRPGGQVVIIDEYTPTLEDQLIAKGDIYALRPLRDGRTFTIVKVFYDLNMLQEKLVQSGFEVTIERLDSIFFFLSAKRQ